jgi:hypothetical protein
MEIFIGIVILVIVFWVLALRNTGAASGKAIANDFNVASEKIQITMNELVREVTKSEPHRLSKNDFQHLVEKAADDLSRYAQNAHLVTSKINQASGQATKPLAEFLSDATAEFAVAIGISIEQRNPAMLLAVMDKYGIKRTE